VYADDTRFTQPALLELARGIASAVGHLHQRGIMHGDLYGHNILRDDEGRSLLGDFGAASFYSLQDTRRAEAFQRLEVRAFGCLLEELIDRCDAASEATGAALRDLKERCLQGDVAARPLFAEIEQALRDLEATTQTAAR
jgi:tRNA A-37 threonylcarbamoyl transferase component Bud32